MSKDNPAFNLSLRELLLEMEGVDVDLSLEHFAYSGMLNKTPFGYVPAGTASEIEFKGGGCRLYVTAQGVAKVFFEYKEGRLPMKKNWDGRFMSKKELNNKLRELYRDKRKRQYG
ncbi:hypothetical protein [Vibrio brasiliensis]|uniref:Uncharacterized protein n=1 Tax=Vibrio brasiliensis LMG 20546 TaxID=945543 RepID=E8LNP4_9VIBR|nr:hypothetical protein [Vibrio brasiliensis]EGA67689.1 hypothetical protein VIBR0546_04477 [Vibrio brasiliensis LMG 20546]